MKRDERGRFAIESGMFIDSKGYWRYSAGEYRDRRVHRVLMEKHLGRELRKDEHVHHRDGNKLNNGDHADGQWNLKVLGESEHNAVSSKQYWFLKTNIWPQEKKAWEEIHGDLP